MTAAASSGGCSVLFHADADQCSRDTDCIARGAPFGQYSTCQQGTCVFSGSSSSASSTSSSTSTSSSSAGPAPCKKNSDCPGAETAPCQSQIACNVDTGQCLQLTAPPECSYIIGDYCGKDEPTYPPIFIGAFAVIQNGDPSGDQSYQNYALAVSEFSAASYAPGVPAGSGTFNSRTPVVVVCDVNGDLNAGMQHLIGDLGVSTIVAPIEPLSKLGSIFQQYDLPGPNPFDGGPGYTGTFMINPLGADSYLTTPPFKTDGLLWHMLGAPTDMVPAYGAFMPLVERYVRHNAPWNLGDTAPMKVATVAAPNELLSDLANGVNPVLTWNGGETIQSIEDAGVDAGGADAGSCPCQSGSNYCALTLSDSTLNGTPYTSINYTQIAQCLLQYQPQVVISYASTEFDYVVQYVEQINPNLQPFYLLSPYNGADQPLVTYVTSSPPLSAGRSARLAGIEFADPTDLTVFNAYQTRFENMPGSIGVGGTAGSNFYDAMYFAIYSLAAAGRTTTITASEIAGGMSTLIGQTPMYPAVDMGPGMSMNTVFSDITQGDTISLVGTLGPPNFNQVTGARISQGDVYCLGPADAGANANYQYDVLRLANPDGGPAADGGALTGTFTCYPGIQ